MNILPVGKLPPALLAELLAGAPQNDPDVVVGPAPGFDCAVVKSGDRYLVLKSDPITFVTDEMGLYLVQVNVNDLATTGATPRWLLVTLLLPEGSTNAELVRHLNEQIYDACRGLDIAVVGGHTEITHGLSRPLAIGTLIGEVSPQKLVTPGGMRQGDHIILTKGIPLEATAILASEFGSELQEVLTSAELARARNFLYEPGISVWRDAQVALAAGEITAMHDPTEGGLAAALWEMAEASQKTLVIRRDVVPVFPLSTKICSALKIDPFAAIASGALLLTVGASETQDVLRALKDEQIPATVIGEVLDEPADVWEVVNGSRQHMERPQRDAIAQLFANRDG